MKKQTTEKETVGTRLKTFLKSINVPVSRFEQAIGVSNGYVNSISRSISPDKISILKLNFPEVNIEWLLTGEGDMLNNIAQHNISGDNIAGNGITVNKAEVDKFVELLSNAQKQIDTSQGQISKSQEQIDRLIGLLEKK